MLAKDIKDLNKWQDMLCSWMGRFSTFKIPILYKLIYSFKPTPLTIPTTFL